MVKGEDGTASDGPHYTDPAQKLLYNKYDGQQQIHVVWVALRQMDHYVDALSKGRDTASDEPLYRPFHEIERHAGKHKS